MHAKLILFSVGLTIAAAAAGEPLATVGSRTIERAAVEKAMAGELLAIETQRYEVLKRGVDGLVNEALLELEAADRGISVEKLVEEEIFAKLGEPTDAEVQALYDEAKDDLDGAPLEQVRPQILTFLEQVQLGQRQKAFFVELRRKYPTKIALAPPSIEVATGNRVRGPAKAPVTIVEFSDYECPFCKRAEATVQKVLATYGDQIRFAYRDFPLDMHANARAAAEAAHCANAQGKFWKYHDQLMAADALSAAAFGEIADRVGLDREAFGRCMKEKTFAAEVDADLEAGERIGVSGTPVFFINGRIVDGAESFEEFQKIIDDELARRSEPGA